MDRAAIYIAIRQTVHSCIPGSRILLFGSHARGDYDSCSDYDLLVITPETLSPPEKLLWSKKLDHALIEAIHAPIDLLLHSEAEVREIQELPGHIVRTAMKEGVSI